MATKRKKKQKARERAGAISGAGRKVLEHLGPQIADAVGIGLMVLAGPDVITRGFIEGEASDEILQEARHRVLLSLKEVEEEAVGDPNILKQHIRRTLGRYFFEAIGRKPMIVPVIMEV